MKPKREGELLNEYGMLGKDTIGGMPSLCRQLELLPGPLPSGLFGKVEWPLLWLTPHVPILYPSFE